MFPHYFSDNCGQMFFRLFSKTFRANRRIRAKLGPSYIRATQKYGAAACLEMQWIKNKDLGRPNRSLIFRNAPGSKPEIAEIEMPVFASVFARAVFDEIIRNMFATLDPSPYLLQASARNRKLQNWILPNGPRHPCADPWVHRCFPAVRVATF